MKLRRREERATRETITSLIDVVFFLLVFFMIVGRMDATAPFAVIPPVASSGTDLPGGGLTVSVAGDGTLAMDGLTLDRAALLERVRMRLDETPAALVRINGDGNAALRHVLPIISAIEALGARDVVIIVTPNPP